MGKRSAMARKHSRHYALASVTLSAVLAVSRPALQAKVFAVGNEYDWTKHEDNDLLGGAYTSAAISADGSHILLSTADGGEGYGLSSPLFISSNYGATWQNIADDIEGPSMRNHWSMVDVSNDGQTMVAASYQSVDINTLSSGDGRIFISQDAGDTWTNISPASIAQWDKLAISGDGSKIVALSEDDNSNVYISTDDGDTWQTTAVSNIYDWESVSISDDGNKILVGGENISTASSLVYYSSNGGTSFTDISPDEGRLMFTTRTAMTDSGNKIAVSSNGYDGDVFDNVFVSEDAGATWTDVTPEDASNNNWVSVAYAGNGSRLAVQDESDHMYLSADDGATWTEEDPDMVADGSNTWDTIDFNESGAWMVTNSSNFAYTGYNEALDTTAEPETVELTDAEGGTTVTLTVPSGVTLTCHSPVKESGLSAQDGAYSYPLGLVDFCFSGADAANDISLVFITDLKPNEVAVRKFNPADGKYTTVTGATITETTVGGKHALQVSYTVTDNGPLDTDPDVGEVADPVGLAVLAATTPNTGLPTQSNAVTVAAVVAGSALTAGALATATTQRRRSQTTTQK